MKQWSPQHYNDPTIRCFLCFIQIFDAIFPTIAPHSLIVFYIQQSIHINITSWSIYDQVHVYSLQGKNQRVHQYVYKKKIAWLINMVVCLSFKPYAKLISLCVRLVSPLRCVALTNEATPSHVNITWPDCSHRSIHTLIQSILFAMYKWSAFHSRPTVWLK